MEITTIGIVKLSEVSEVSGVKRTRGLLSDSSEQLGRENWDRDRCVSLI